MAIASLVLGIISLFISFGFGAAGMGWVGSLCGLLAIILGALSRSGPQRNLATGGLVCGIIALTWGVVATIACVACLGAGAAAIFSTL